MNVLRQKNAILALQVKIFFLLCNFERSYFRLEVQAELESELPVGKRASFSSASANFSIGEKSLGEKSATGDDASTRGLAGSIVNYK